MSWLRSHNGIYTLVGTGAVVFAMFNGFGISTLIVAAVLGVVGGLYNGFYNS